MSDNFEMVLMKMLYRIRPNPENLLYKSVEIGF